MSGQKSNIEKYNSRLIKDINFTVVLNKVVQNIHDVDVLGLYVYLASLPPEWEINKIHLRKHFKMGETKMDNLFKKLKEANLLILEEHREKGRFVGVNYRLCLDFHRTVETAPTETAPTEITPYINNIYKKRNNNKNTISESGDSPIVKDIVDEVLDAYHETLPDMPKVKHVTTELRRAIKKMEAEWPSLRNKVLTKEVASSYFMGLKELTPFLLQPYKTKEGNVRRNRLINLIRLDTIKKFYNGDYCAE
jgi:hypothetical protein